MIDEGTIMNPEPFPLKDTIESAILSAAGIGKELPEDRAVLLRLIDVTGQATSVCSQLQLSLIHISNLKEQNPSESL